MAAQHNWDATRWRGGPQQSAFNVERQERTAPTLYVQAPTAVNPASQSAILGLSQHEENSLHRQFTGSWRRVANGDRHRVETPLTLDIPQPPGRNAVPI